MARNKQNLNTNRYAVADMISQYGVELKRDPTKVMLLDIAFASANGLREKIYFKCCPDANGHAVWDLFGINISYTMPDSIAKNYMLYKDYYRGIPDNLIMSELKAATIVSYQIL